MKTMLLALVLISGPGLAEAFGIDYEVRAKAGDSAAQYYLRRASALARTGYAEYWAGIHFLNGIKGFMVPDKTRAIGSLKESCAQGFDSACDELDSPVLAGGG
jgi:TPR repeat protein